MGTAPPPKKKTPLAPTELPIIIDNKLPKFVCLRIKSTASALAS